MATTVKITGTHYDKEEELLDLNDAVRKLLERAATGYEGAVESVAARQEILATFVGNAIEKLYEKGVLDDEDINSLFSPLLRYGEEITMETTS